MPQAALGLPVVENETGSLAVGEPLGPVTVAVTVDVDEPLPGRLAGEADMATELTAEAGVWVIIAVFDAPLWDSVAVIVQKPGVVDAV